ncbi:MAG: cell envelope integrity protein CreD [Parasphingopyxis sp.]|uniref:cell envelope integrity protein CreD n=1 Tax=Parasphingopyxis sp. TaxID=1920299 RepID=UPI003F9ED626
MSETSTDRSPGFKLALVLLAAFLLSIPLFTIWLLVYDREQQSQTALASIAEGWGGPQILSGPQLVIPYRAQTTETTQENGRTVTRTRTVSRELVLAPQTLALETELAPERRARSIYEAVVYRATTSGRASFALPDDLSRLGVERSALALDRAELRFGLSDMRGIQAADIRFDGRDVALQSGGGANGPGFSALVDAASLSESGIDATFAVAFRGNQRLSLQPLAGETEWTVRSSWPHPSFQGGFLPDASEVSAEGFSATYRITNLALGRSLVSTGAPSGEGDGIGPMPAHRYAYDVPPGEYETRVSLIQPVDLYSQVDRSVKYGFLIIGFTFLAYLMFDVIAGVRVSTVEYLLVGAALVLFFVLLLAFAELIGFGWAFIVAAAAIVGLNTSYSAAVLRSWRRAAYIGGLLAGLYAVMFILLSLETFSLLIGSLLLFVALAAIMYATRNIDWGRSGASQT